MIPKKIHYCWFGRKELPEKAKKCIASWKKYCPDFEIIEWNEDNYDVYQNEYTKYCYENKKYAFLSDYARLQIISREGGIYFDIDVEVIKNIDDLLQHEAFFGFETKEFVNTGVGFGATAHHPTVQAMIAEYDGVLDGSHGTIGCPHMNTRALTKLGLVQNGNKQVVAGAVIYPIAVFNPYDDPTGRLNVTPETYSIHWFAKSWQSKSTIVRSKISKPLHRIFGTDFFRKKK